MNRKLKGKAVKKIDKKKKQKMNKTLKRMSKVREEDSILLRTIINTKLKWLNTQKANLEIELRKKQICLNKTSGAIIALQDVLEESHAFNKKDK